MLEVGPESRNCSQVITSHFGGIACCSPCVATYIGLTEPTLCCQPSAGAGGRNCQQQAQQALYGLETECARPACNKILSIAGYCGDQHANLKTCVIGRLPTGTAAGGADEYSDTTQTGAGFECRRTQVDGWADARMPTVQGIFRRGLQLAALKEFIIFQGSTKNVNLQAS